MKKLVTLAVTLLLVLSATAAFAELPITFFDGWNTTGAGTPKTTPQTYKTWACQATTTGNPSEVVIGLQGNIKGTTAYDTLAWHTFTASELSAKAAFFYPAVDKPLIRFRGNVGALSWNTGGVLYLYCVGVR